MDSLNKIVKGAGIVFFGVIISKFLTYLNRAVIARIGVEQYGLFSISLAVFGIFGMLAVLGLNQGVIRYVSYYKNKNDYNRVKGVITSSLKYGILASILLTAILYASSDYLATNIFHNTEISIFLKIISMGLPFYTLREILFSAIKSYSLRAEYETIFKNILENFIKVFGTLFFLYLGYNVIGVAYANTIAMIITFLISLYIIEKKIFPILNTSIVSISEKRELLNYSIPLLLSMLLSQIITWSDSLMIGFFKGVAEVGIYNTAIPTVTLLCLAPDGIIVLMMPILTQLYTLEKTKELHTTIRSATKWIFYINLPIFISLILFGKEILLLFFGSYYEAAYPALLTLSIGYVIYQFLYPVYETLKVFKKTKFILLNTLLTAIINIILNYFLIPQYGIVGGAIATSFSLMYFSITSLLKFKKLMKIWPFSGGVINAIISVIFSGAIAHLMILIIPQLDYLILKLLMIFIIYIIMLIILKSFDVEDMIIIHAIKYKLKF